MIVHTSVLRPARTVLRYAAVLALLSAAGRQPAHARGAAAAPPPNVRLGAQLLDQAARWIGAPGPGGEGIRDAFLEGVVEFDVPGRSLRGRVGCWWKQPDRFRLDLTSGGQTTSRILAGENAWIVVPGSPAQRLHGTPEARETIAQWREDRARIEDLARWIALRGMDRRGATLRFEGERIGSGPLAGRWLEVARRAPGSRTLRIWLAYVRDGAGRYRATWPGIVRIAGDTRHAVPTEDYVFRRWASVSADARPHRVPREVEAWRTRPGHAPERFLRLDLRKLVFDGEIPDARFAPPTR